MDRVASSEDFGGDRGRRLRCRSCCFTLRRPSRPRAFAGDLRELSHARRPCRLAGGLPNHLALCGRRSMHHPICASIYVGARSILRSVRLGAPVRSWSDRCRLDAAVLAAHDRRFSRFRSLATARARLRPAPLLRFFCPFSAHWLRRALPRDDPAIGHPARGLSRFDVPLTPSRECPDVPALPSARCCRCVRRWRRPCGFPVRLRALHEIEWCRVACGDREFVLARLGGSSSLEAPRVPLAIANGWGTLVCGGPGAKVSTVMSEGTAPDRFALLTFFALVSLCCASIASFVCDYLRSRLTLPRQTASIGSSSAVGVMRRAVSPFDCAAFRYPDCRGHRNLA
jgi:hypothetical protein